MAVCDIESLIDSLTFEVNMCARPRMCNPIGNIWAVVFIGTGDRVYLVTFSCDNDGNISAVLDLACIDANSCSTPNICVAGTGVVAIVYKNYYLRGYLSTWTVGADGTISTPCIDEYQFEDGTCTYPYILYTGSSDLYVISYEDSSVRGCVKTLTINSSGNITSAVIDYLMFDAGNGGQPIIIYLLMNIFVIFYIGPAYDVKLCSIRIENNGQISDAIIDSFVFETGGDHQVGIAMILPYMLACVYRTDASHGKLKTTGCNSNGFFDGEVKDSYNFPDANFAYPAIAMIGAECYAITYQGVDNDGWLKTIIINSIGQIAADITDSLEFDEVYGGYSQLKHIEGDTFLLIHEGDDKDGKARSIAIQP